MTVRITNESCIDTMSNMTEESVDLIITSPPYDSLRDYGGNTDFQIDKIVPPLMKVLKTGGVIVWVVNDSTIKGSETGTSFRQALRFMDEGFNLHDTMIYMKDNPPPTGGNNRYFSAFEYMFVFSKGVPKTFNPITEPRRNKWNDKRTVRFRPVVRNKAGVFTANTVHINDGLVKLQNVWSYTVGGGSMTDWMEAHKHPAIFPEALARDHIVSWSNVGDTVYDPMMGSGTVGAAALVLGRSFVGSEIHPEYFELAKSRLGAKLL
jgi:site-specific DNA-methyltransferase (adenine-specific)